MTDHDNDDAARRARIFLHLARIERALVYDEVLFATLHHTIHNLNGRIHVNRDDINREIQALRDLIVEDNRRDQEAVDTLNGTIDGLKRQVADLSLPTPDQAAFDDIFGQLEGLRALITPVDASSGATNRTTTDANGGSPIAGTTAGGTPINTPDPLDVTTSTEPPTDTNTSAPQ